MDQEPVIGVKVGIQAVRISRSAAIHGRIALLGIILAEHRAPLQVHVSLVPVAIP